MQTGYRESTSDPIGEAWRQRGEEPEPRRPQARVSLAGGAPPPPRPGVAAGGRCAPDASQPPIVCVDQPDRSGNASLFNADKAAYDATLHLVRHGHRRIGCVTGPPELPN